MIYQCADVSDLILAIHRAFLKEVGEAAQISGRTALFTLKLGICDNVRLRRLGVRIGSDAYQVDFVRASLHHTTQAHPPTIPFSVSPMVQLPPSHLDRLFWLLLHFLELQNQTIVPEWDPLLSGCAYERASAR